MSPVEKPTQADRIASAVRNADDVSERICAGGYRATLSDVEALRNDVRFLARLAADQAARTKTEGRQAADELRALAALIERPPLDDVVLEKVVASRAAAAIRVVLQEQGL